MIAITQHGYKIILMVHIAFGFTAFFLAPGALATVKGGKAHRLFGKIYFWAMAGVAVTAIVMATSSFRPNPFLAMVAIFSFYAAFAGYRVLYQKRPLQGQGPKPIDWCAALITLAGSLFLVSLGFGKSQNVFLSLGPVAAIFGGIGIFLSGSSIYKFLRPSPDKNDWWYSHMGSMIGSYIAAVTAFSATAFPRFIHHVPRITFWIWPSAIGAPLISIWIAYYKRKFNRRKAMAA